MYNVNLSESAESIYNNLEGKDLKKVNKGLSLIERSPLYYPGKIIPLKNLLKGKFRCKEDRWRIIYTIDDRKKEVNIETICLRDSDTYRE